MRVAVYCRVSTDRQDQANSFEAQQRYFAEYIRARPDWELYAVYADEGITGTTTQNRLRFNRMLRDARAGAFDLILTKEVSRFSRNILDAIACTRELKAMGVGVLFVTDGIHTMEPDAELRLSIMSSIAQEESRKTSARVKWGQTRQMERGVVFGRSLLGYRVEKGVMTVDPEQAELVRLIFRKYVLERKGTTVIARELREAGWRTASGSVRWSPGHLLKILKNEKYVGDLVQKKTYTPDYLTHRKKYNHGQEPLVIIRDHHQPIVSRELWEQAQEEIARRNRRGAGSEGHSNRYLFSGRIKCGVCGSSFVSRKRVRSDGSAYRRWTCYRAVSEGRAGVDGQGNPVGCSIGRSIRDELALHLLRRAVLAVPVDRAALAGEAAALAVQAREETGRAERLERERTALHRKKNALLDTYLAGDITREEMLSMRRHYEDALTRNLARAAPLSPPEALEERAVDIACCGCEADSLYRTILQKLVVLPGGEVEVFLRHLETPFRFRPVSAARAADIAKNDR